VVPVKTKTVSLILCSLLFPVAALSQTYEVDGQQAQPAANSPNAQHQKKNQPPQTNATGEDAGLAA